MKKVLVVHGMFMNIYVMLPFVKKLEKAGYKVRVFSYPILPKADDVTKRFIEEVSGFQPDYLVGHSFGGAMSLHNIHHFPTIEKVVCLGSPLRGTRIKETFLGDKLLSLVPQSMRTIVTNGVHIPKRTSLLVGSIAGTDNRLSPLGLLSDIGLPNSVRHLVGQKQRSPVSENDGIVLVSETRAGSHAFHTKVFANHIQLIFSDDAHKQTIHFLDEGRFLKSTQPIVTH